MVANPHRGEIAVSLFVEDTDADPRPLTVKSTFTAWCNIEQRLKRPLAMIAGEFGNYSPNAIAVALQELFAAGGHKFGLDEVGRIIELNGLDKMTAPGGMLFGPLELIMGGHRQLFPPAEEKPDQKKAPAKRKQVSRGNASPT